MTVLVTGAAGFLGSHVTDLLLASGERPRVLIRPGDGRGPLEAAGADIYTGDIGDRATIGAALRGVDRVLHCAARTGPWGPAADYERTNVRGLETLVTAALAAGVRRVVHVSSITVHGNDVGGQADETAPLREEPNPYSRSKVAGERLLERLIRDQFARLARMIERGQMIMFGRGTNHLPLIYARDAARGVVLASAANGAEGRPYLLVNDEPVTQRDFLRAIAAGLGAPAPTRHLPYRLATLAGAIAEDLGRLAGRRQPPPVMRYGIQLLGGENRFIISRSRRELGFSPHVDLAEGVRHSVEWYLGASRAAERAAVHQRADGRIEAPRRGAGDTA